MHRLEVGVSYVLPSELAEDARSPCLSKSTFNADCLVKVFLSPRTRPCKMLRGDVVFSIVAASPEAKHNFHAAGSERSTWNIFVRSHASLERDGDVVPSAWSLECWNIRNWCSSLDRTTMFLSCLLRRDGLEQRSSVTTARSRPPQIPDGAPRMRLPAPF